ncbi:hypothetical protein IWW50_002732, partial [Coemansia erecta]
MTSPSDTGDQLDRLPPNAQRPMSVASSDSLRARSLSSSASRRLSQATELLAVGSPPAGPSYIHAVAASVAETDEESASADMVLPEAVAARRLKRHLVTRRPRSGLDVQAQSYGSNGFSDDESVYTDEANDEGEGHDEVPVDPFTLPSGDITHHLYRWQEEHSGQSSRRDSTRRRHTRTHSFSAVASDSEWDVYTPNQIRAPGG